MTFGYNEILDIITGGAAATEAEIKEVDECINGFMTSDIQFLGRTFFDELISDLAVKSTKKIQTLGLLNFFCHQYSIFSLYVGHLDLLKQRMLAYIDDPANIVVGNYFNIRFKIGSGRPRDPVKQLVTNFLTYIRQPIPPPVPGGRRRRMSRKKIHKSKRKTRQRKHR